MSTDARSPGDSTRARILSEALPLFAAKGFAGTSIRMIASAADVNVAAIAWHFGDKDGLYATVIDGLYAELATMELGDLLRADDPILTFVARALAFIRDHDVQIRLMHRYFLDRGQHHEVFADRWLEPLMARAAPFFEALRPDWPETERRLLLFTVAHLLVRFALEAPATLAVQLGTDDVDAALAGWIASLVRARLTAA